MARVVPVRSAASVDRRAADSRWRAEVDAKIGDLQRGQAVLHEGQERNFRLVEENTEITRRGLQDLDGKIDAAISETRPVVQALQTMESGIKTVGTIGRFGKRVALGGLYLIGGWFFLRHLISGEGLEAAVGAFWKAVSGGK